MTPSSLYIPQDDGARDSWLEHLAGISVCTLVYVLGGLIAYWYSAGLVGGTPDIVSVVNGLKLTSLVGLGAVGAYELAKAPSPPRLLSLANGALIFLILVSVMILFARLNAGPDDDRAIIQWHRTYGSAFAVLPLLAYGLLNVVTAVTGWVRKRDIEYSFRAALFLAVSDIPCLLPLIAIGAALAKMKQVGLIGAEDAELVWAGAMAIFVYISALLAVTSGFILRRLCTRPS